jgi:pimeloyl-ACP methyl ester carboxylesterase
MRAGPSELGSSRCVAMVGDRRPDMLAALIPDLAIETIPETTHNVLREKPDHYRTLLAEFFGE